MRLPSLVAMLFTSSLVAAELPGPLVLVGSGPTPKDARQAFVELAGKKKARILIVSSSKDAAETLKPWDAYEPSGAAVLAIKDPKQAEDPEFVKPLAEATGIWFDDSKSSGIRGTRLEKELRKLHARGGVIGARGEALSIGQELLEGFNLDVGATAASQPNRVGLALPASSAVVIRGRQLRVIGDESVSLAVAAGAGHPAVSASVKAGNMLDLEQLRRSAANRAAKDPFPPAKPRTPVVEKGSLVIVGGGGAGPEIWKRFIELAGGPDSLVVFVPTALEDPIGFSFPEVAALQKYGAKNVHILHTRHRSEANAEKFSEPLTRAKGLWFGGGRQWRFVDAYEGTLTEKRFHELLGRGGVIGGSSAGASIQSEYMPRGHPLGNTVMMAEGYEKGFGFLRGAAVDQHFFARKRTADMTDLMEAYPQYLGIGIDEGTAIVVQGSKAEVIGRSKVGFYDYSKGKPKGDTDYVEVMTGGKYDLKERKILE